MDTPTALPSVFVSFNKEDRPWAEWIAWTLEEAGHRVVYQPWDFRPGSNFVLEMQKAAAETDKTLIVLSDNYLLADYTQPEWAAAFARDPQGRERKLVPVRIAECSPKGLLAPIVWVNLIGLSPAEARDTLLQEFADRGKPSHPPAFPGAAPPERASRTAIPFPGDPPLHNLPYLRLGDLFTGRQKELDLLAGGSTAAIYGLGGIGKTRLAVEYAWRSGHLYSTAWFVRADSPESLHRNLAALAEPELLNLPEWGAQVEDEIISAVKRWLREHAGWLMILDNVDSPAAAEAVLAILPSLSKGRILITSRLSSWPASVRDQSLGTLSCDESVRFLLHRTENGRASAADDAVHAAALAKLLDGLPLALEQAAAFILRRKMRFAEYLQAWERERSEVLRWHDPLVMEYPMSVAVTWQQTFRQLSPKPAALLRLMAFLAPDPIPIDVFEQGAEMVEQAAQRLCEEVAKEPDKLSVQAALDELAEYSMIARQDGGTIAVHRLVQEVLRDQLPQNHRKAWIEWTLRAVDEATVDDPGDVRAWIIWDRLRPHAAEVVTLADESGILDPTSHLMNELGGYLHAKALYSEAEPLLRRALTIRSSSADPQSPDVAVVLNNLSALLQATNRLREAEPLIRRSLAIGEAVYGSEHPIVARGLHNLAALLLTTNRLHEAESLMRRALAIDEKAFGNAHPHIARGLNNLAVLLREADRLQEAVPLIRRALTIDETAFGSEHPNVARDLNNLAQLLMATNRLAEAEPLVRHALAIDETTFGNKHPNIAVRLNTLAQLLQNTNRKAEAEALLRRALEIDETALGDRHPNVATDLNNLSQLLQDVNRLGETEALMRRALAIDEASFGSEHPNVARDLANLAPLLQATNRLEEAERLMRRALVIDEASYGSEHLNVAKGLNNLAQLFKATARPREARSLLQRALYIAEKSLGPGHPTTEGIRTNLAPLLS